MKVAILGNGGFGTAMAIALHQRGLTVSLWGHDRAYTEAIARTRKELEEAIRHHHSPHDARLKPALAHCVHLADAACMMLGVGLGVDGMMYAIDPASMALLGVDGARLQALMEDVAPLMTGDALAL